MDPQYSMYSSFFMLALMLVLFYFILIRPQKKKDKETDKMRKGVQVGDEIVTIGGIVGKVVRTKEESITIQVGADKMKFDVMRWAISKVTVPAKSAAKKTSIYDAVEEEAPKKGLPKRMKKAENEE